MRVAVRRSNSSFCTLSFVALLCLAFLTGCGNDGAGVKLAPFAGRVTFKNQAVTAAEIFLIPDEEKGTKGDMGSAILNPEKSSASWSAIHPSSSPCRESPSSEIRQVATKIGTSTTSR